MLTTTMANDAEGGSVPCNDSRSVEERAVDIWLKTTRAIPNFAKPSSVLEAKRLTKPLNTRGAKLRTLVSNSLIACFGFGEDNQLQIAYTAFMLSHTSRLDNANQLSVQAATALGMENHSKYQHTVAVLYPLHSLAMKQLADSISAKGVTCCAACTNAEASAKHAIECITNVRFFRNKAHKILQALGFRNRPSILYTRVYDALYQYCWLRSATAKKRANFAANETVLDDLKTMYVNVLSIPNYRPSTREDRAVTTVRSAYAFVLKTFIERVVLAVSTGSSTVEVDTIVETD